MPTSWRGVDTIQKNTFALRVKMEAAMKEVAEHFGPILEEYAKTYAPWQDQTGMAREKLNYEVKEIARGIVALYLQHGVDYGIYLETKFAGRDAVLWPTIEAHLPEIKAMLQRRFSR